jgi:hypothetical protein
MSSSGGVLTRLLLACGVLSSLVYVVANVAAAWRWPEYSSISQTVSELSAIDAPSRSTWVPFGIAYDVLVIAFGVGVWRWASRVRPLRIAGALLAAIGALGFFWPPMHLRGAPQTMTDTLHIVFAAVVSVLTMLAMVFGARGLGRGFRLYSWASLAIVVASGAWTGLAGPRVAANLPTPWIGVTERVDIGAYILWVAVLAGVQLYRKCEPRK